jgi:hypothetical protein
MDDLGGAYDGAAREEERHARGEVEGPREPDPGRHVQRRPSRRAAAVDAGHGARERRRVERPAVPGPAEVIARTSPAPRRRPRRTVAPPGATAMARTAPFSHPFLLEGSRERRTPRSGGVGCSNFQEKVD